MKVMKIYSNASTLSLGATIVDLPGSADTNKEHSGIAAKYMNDCSHVWVVMDIKRAVDDQNAKGAQGLCENLILNVLIEPNLDLVNEASQMQFLCEYIADTVPTMLITSNA